jgi:RNA polymerase sigma factor (TIGR02999 family)
LPAGEVTVLLQRLTSETGAERKRTYDELIGLVYEDLRRRAQAQVGREFQQQSLRATALVHEAYESMMDYKMPFEGRQHFLNVAASAMRRLLIDRARRLSAEKRGSRQSAEPLKEHHAVEDQDPETLLALDAALQSLRPEQVQLVELRYFAGLTMEETASAMGLQVETVKKRWQAIKLLLFDRLAAKKSHGKP